MRPCVHFDSRGVVLRAYVKTDYFNNFVGGRHNPENTASARLARKTNFVCLFVFFFGRIQFSFVLRLRYVYIVDWKVDVLKLTRWVLKAVLIPRFVACFV